MKLINLNIILFSQYSRDLFHFDTRFLITIRLLRQLKKIPLNNHVITFKLIFQLTKHGRSSLIKLIFSTKTTNGCLRTSSPLLIHKQSRTGNIISFYTS